MNLTVTAHRPGFRRAGRAWSGTVTVDAAGFTAAQIAALRAEPLLSVSEVAPSADKPAARK